MKISGADQGDEAIEPSMKCRNGQDEIETEVARFLVISLEETCLLFKRSPAYRWHELDPGFCTEHGNLCFDVKGEIR
jgi:hypothetical protein